MNAPIHSTAGQPASGRPRASSRGTLAEAAAELFLERTYAGTTIEDIARRAGVSRATFFNYFDAKSDLLWVEVDESLAQFEGVLGGASGSAPVMQAVHDSVVALAAEFGPGRLPLAVTQYELMGTNAELESSALSRFLALVRLLSDFVALRTGDDPGALLPRSIATAVIGAAIASAGVWARSGVGRGALGPYVAAAIGPVCAGYQAVLDEAAATG